MSDESVIEEVRNLIKEWIKIKEYNIKEGTPLMSSINPYLTVDKLNPKQKDLFPKAIESLIEDDLLEERTLALTKKGYDLVYGSDESVIEELMELIKEWIKEYNLKEGSPLESINMYLTFGKLNPKQSDLSQKAIESLVEEGLLEENTLALTKKGYDLVYGS